MEAESNKKKENLRYADKPYQIPSPLRAIKNKYNQGHSLNMNVLGQKHPRTVSVLHAKQNSVVSNTIFIRHLARIVTDEKSKGNLQQRYKDFIHEVYQKRRGEVSTSCIKNRASMQSMTSMCSKPKMPQIPGVYSKPKGLNSKTLIETSKFQSPIHSRHYKQASSEAEAHLLNQMEKEKIERDYSNWIR